MKHSVIWVMALAVAGGTPTASRLVVVSTPKARPRAPSTIWARKPMTTKSSKSAVR
ncbi:hypothetical protein [Shinella sp.]|uniref:hypothetical protein n=1 Tax=Shinella sp. TaxID=1870904 RepID=UPI002590748F|nr:hypothetical protein [Shinella sp.]